MMMQSKLLLLSVAALVGVSLVQGHSWVHCADYRGDTFTVGSIDNTKCNGFPRGVSTSTVFGVDIGLDYTPSANAPCRGTPGTPSVTYQKGSTYRVLWPAKNHQAATCTNAFIPDTTMKLFAVCGTAGAATTDPTLATFTSSANLVWDWKTQAPGKGFQNCPDFCSGTDKAPCFGDFSIATDSSLTGTCKFLWYWEFNPGQFYTHCWDATVTAASGTPDGISTGGDSDSEATDAPCANPAYGQCGGANYTGETCCSFGQYCYQYDSTYSQCVPSAAEAASIQGKLAGAVVGTFLCTLALVTLVFYVYHLRQTGALAKIRIPAARATTTPGNPV